MATAWGLFHNLDSHPCQVFIADILEEAQMCVCSPSSTWDSLTLRGNFSMKVWASQIEAASVRSYGVGQRMGIKYRLHMGRHNNPVCVMQKHGHKSTISKRHQVGRHWAELQALLQGIRCSYERTKCRNQASVSGCTQSYY